MKQKVFAWILVLILALTPVLAIAEGEGASDPLKIDTYWKYPGMEKSYAGGYMPEQKDGKVQFIVPLLGKTQGNTIRVVPEFPTDGPFAPSNLQFDVSEKTYDVTQGKENKTGRIAAYLIQFSAPLKSTYYNGTYAVQLHVTYKTPAGDPTEQTFTVQLQITGGKTQSSGGGGGQSSVKKPVILIQSCAVTPNEVSGGENAAVSVSMCNVGNYDAKNIRVALVPESEAIALRGDLNAKFFDALPINETLDADFDLQIAEGAEAGPAIVTVQIGYEDKYGGSYTEEGRYTINVTQPRVEIVDCAYSEVVNGGDGFTVTLTLRNTGTRDARDVTVRHVSGDEAIRNKGLKDTEKIGTLKKGETATVTFDLRALPSAEQGRHSMEFLCTYADAGSAGTYESSMRCELTVYQEASVGYDEIRLPETLTSGETFVLPICVYNSGFSRVYNVRGVLNVDGLICSSAYLGSIAPQDAATKELSVFVTTLSGGQKYGETWGWFELRYENEDGETQTLTQDLKSTVQEPVKITDEEKERQEKEQKEQQTLSQWWISLLVAIAIIIILIAVIVIARFSRLLRMK